MMFLLMNIFLMMMITDSTGNCQSSFKARQRVSDADDFHDAGTGNFHAGDDNSNGDIQSQAFVALISLYCLFLIFLKLCIVFCHNSFSNNDADDGLRARLLCQ